MRRWKLTEARARFGEVVRRAEAGEPQVITRNGREVAVVVGIEHYIRPCAAEGLVEFIKKSPLPEAVRSGGFNEQRPPDFGREINI